MKLLSNLLSILFTIVSITGFSQTTDSFTTTGANTWTCPIGVTTVDVQVWGAGGGSGGGGNVNKEGSGGGGGGGYAYRTSIAVTAGATYNLIVGAAGAAVGAGANGNNGGLSRATFGGTVLTANGGSRGLNGNTGRTGGNGGTATGGTTNNTGGNGGNGSGSDGAGGGGEGACTTGNGNNGINGNNGNVNEGQAGAGCDGGDGGTGNQANGGNGTNGVAIGGGGGGSTKNRGGRAGARGQVDITYISPGGGAGDDCASPTRLTCGGAAFTGETTIGLTDIEDDWACSTLLGANNYPGLDHFYVVQWPDAVNGGSIRIDITNVVDADATYLELMTLGSTCAPSACVGSNQMTIATGLFGGINTFVEFTVGAGVTDYYFVVDSQGDGVDDAITSYDIQAICFATGIEMDVNSNCTPIPVTAAANQGYYATWDGAAPPATGNAVTLAAAGPYTICENIYIENPAGWEWLKDFDVTLGDCWINISNLTPNGSFNGFYNTLGDWMSTIGGGTPNVLNWTFDNFDNSTWGDGSVGAYNCNLYTFCYTADVDPTCNVNTGLQNSISGTDDGVGAGGGGAVNANNITIGSTSPTVLPIELLSFSASLKERDGRYAVILNWRTSTEINNDYFTVERSVDGSEYEEIFTTPAAGNSSDINNYFGVDEAPYEGVSYYRLKQTDFDGKFEYFDIVPVNISNITDLKIYPNPVRSEMTVSMKAKLDNSVVSINIYNTQGELIIHQNNILNEGMNDVQIDMGKYAQGLYFISLEHDGVKKHLKFSKK
jgi:hypothetical protein